MGETTDPRGGRPNEESRLFQAEELERMGLLPAGGDRSAGELFVGFAEAPRGTYQEIRNARPDQAAARQALTDLLEAVKVENCTPQESYIRSLGMK